MWQMKNQLILGHQLLHERHKEYDEAYQPLHSQHCLELVFHSYFKYVVGGNGVLYSVLEFSIFHTIANYFVLIRVGGRGLEKVFDLLHLLNKLIFATVLFLLFHRLAHILSFWFHRLF